MANQAQAEAQAKRNERFERKANALFQDIYKFVWSHRFYTFGHIELTLLAPEVIAKLVKKLNDEKYVYSIETTHDELEGVETRELIVRNSESQHAIAAMVRCEECTQPYTVCKCNNWCHYCDMRNPCSTGLCNSFRFQDLFNIDGNTNCGYHLARAIRSYIRM